MAGEGKTDARRVIPAVGSQKKKRRKKKRPPSAQITAQSVSERSERNRAIVSLGGGGGGNLVPMHLEETPKAPPVLLLCPIHTVGVETRRGGTDWLLAVSFLLFGGSFATQVGSRGLSGCSWRQRRPDMMAFGNLEF